MNLSYHSQCMRPMSNRAIFRWGLLICVTGALLLALSSALEAGRDLRFTIEREAATQLPPQTIDHSMRILSNWPRWHRGVIEAQAVDVRGEPFPSVEQTLEPGSIVRLMFKPKPDGPPAYLKMRIGRYASNYLLQAHLIEDSTGSITAQFSEVSWEIDFPRPERIRLRVHAVPATVKAKILCLIAKPLVLANLAIPQVDELARIKQPSALELAPPHER